MQDLAQQWKKDGYIIVRNLLSSDRAAQLNQICQPILAQWRRRNPQTGDAGGPDATVMRHLNHPDYFAQDPAAKAALLEAIADDHILTVCRTILGQTPLFRCTSLFMNPTQTSKDGNWHRDSQFHCPDEEDEKKMIAAGGQAGTSIQLQVALIPSDDIEVVPGSHLRWDTAQEYAIRRADKGRNSTANTMPNAKRVALAPGDAVAFNPCGLHRGRYHADKPRRTLMLTYTASTKPRFDFFSDQPWFSQPGYLDGLNDKAHAFFKRFVDQYQEEWKKAN